MMTKHANTGRCPKCQEIFDRYPGFYLPLHAWFESLQLQNPEAHISCAGRGMIEQEALFQRKATRARYAQSAHNWNTAIDIFAVIPDVRTIYPPEWFHNKIAPQIPDWIEWYGRPSASFPELPHFEPKNWRDLATRGLLKLVGE